MSKARTWTLGLVIAMLVVILAGWQLGISPIASQIGLANSQAATIDASNAATESKLAVLKTQYAGIGKLQSKLDALRLSIPEQAAAASFLSEVTSLASESGATVESVTLADASLFQASNAGVSGAAAATTDTTSTPAPTATPGIGSVGTSVTSGGLVSIQVTISATGAYSALQEFVGLIQNGPRLFVSNSVSLDGGATGASTVLSGDIFTLQGTSDQAAGGGSSTGATSTSTPTPYPTLTPTPTPTPTPSSSTKSGTSANNSQPTPTPTPTGTAGP
jgi:Tfp pilus assembly protein PilO